jgi:hypothetical protein
MFIFTSCNDEGPLEDESFTKYNGIDNVPLDCSQETLDLFNRDYITTTVILENDTVQGRVCNLDSADVTQRYKDELSVLGLNKETIQTGSVLYLNSKDDFSSFTIASKDPNIIFNESELERSIKAAEGVALNDTIEANPSAKQLDIVVIYDNSPRFFEIKITRTPVRNPYQTEVSEHLYEYEIVGFKSQPVMLVYSGKTEDRRTYFHKYIGPRVIEGSEAKISDMVKAINYPQVIENNLMVMNDDPTSVEAVLDVFGDNGRTIFATIFERCLAQTDSVNFGDVISVPAYETMEQSINKEAPMEINSPINEL